MRQYERIQMRIERKTVKVLTEGKKKCFGRINDHKHRIQSWLRHQMSRNYDSVLIQIQCIELSNTVTEYVVKR